jgi:hypothetical protein
MDTNRGCVLHLPRFSRKSSAVDPLGGRVTLHTSCLDAYNKAHNVWMAGHLKRP